MSTEAHLASPEDILEVTEFRDVEYILRVGIFETVGPHDNFSVGIENQAKVIGDSILMARGEDHFQRRRLESVLFRRETLASYEEELIRPRVAAVVRSLADRANSRPVSADLVKVSESVFLKLMATLVGLDLDSPADEQRFAALFAKLDAAVRVKYANDMERALQEGLDAQQELDERFFTPSYKRREQLLSGDSSGGTPVPNDLITLMIRHRDHFDRWDEGLLLRESTLFITASVGSLTARICSAFDDIEHWIADHPDDVGGRLDPEFLSLAIRETLRVNQVVPVVGRVAMEPCVLPSGREIAAGDLVRVHLIEANRELFGKDNDTFNPRRRLPEGTPQYGLAFSGGRHTCIGKWLVLGGETTNDGRLGAVRAALLELYLAGMRRDVAGRPQMKDMTVRTYASYPVVFASDQAA